jgi:hypothetical protein
MAAPAIIAIFFIVCYHARKSRTFRPGAADIAHHSLRPV